MGDDELPMKETLRRHAGGFPGAGVCRVVMGMVCGLGWVGAWVPGTGVPMAVDGFVVDAMNRRDVLAFYQTVYVASEGYAARMGWTGSVSGGVAGGTSLAFREDVRRRVNFYRALAGMPGDVVFDAVKSAKAQEAALMFARNNGLSHFPPTNWIYYTANAAEAAGASNIAIGTHGPASVDAYMRDDGSGNEVVGHRRWLQYSRARVMGSGDVPVESPYNRANAVWVIGDFKAAPAAAFSAWPSRGYVPVGLVPARWSVSYPGADFSGATVAMTVGGVAVAAPVISRVDNGYGDNTLVWTPAGVPGSVSADVACEVTVTGIKGAGVPTSHAYTVRLFDPGVLGDRVVISGSDAPPVSGAAYGFNRIEQADSYELRVATGSVAGWTEGAEDLPVPQIAAMTTGTYAVRGTTLARSGSKSFQLAFPDFADQGFVITRDVVVTAASQLRFFERARFTTTTTTLHAEVSTDNGGSWTSVWSRSGVGLNSGLWDGAFNARSVSLGAYAGEVVRVRFMLRRNGGSISVGTGENHGFFIDDVTVTDATELVNGTTTVLGGGATGFTLNGASAGAALSVGTRYYLRVRPNVGTRWFGYGPLKVVTAKEASGFGAWLAQYPGGSGGVMDDHDRDGLTNGVEYAFGLNPTVGGGVLPQVVKTASELAVTFAEPAGVSGVVYGAEWSRDMVTWRPVADSGSGGGHAFRVGTSGEPRMYFRYRITVAP